MSSKVRSIIIWAIGSILLTALVLVSITPKQYDLEIGKPSPEMIVATKRIEDTYTTEQRRGEAEAKVDTIYKRDETVTYGVIDEINQAWESVDSVIITLNTAVEKAGSFNKISQEEKQSIIKSLSFDADVALLKNIYETSKQDAIDAKMSVASLVGAMYSEGVINKDNAVNELTNKIKSDPNVVNSCKDIAIRVIETNLKPNMLVDVERTKAEKQAARNAVEPVVYEKGVKIIGEHELVERKHIDVLTKLGLLSGSSYDIVMYIGVALMVLMLMVVAYFYIYKNERALLHNTKMLIMYLAVVIINIGLALLLKPFSPYMPQATFAVMIITLLLRFRLALITNIIVSVLISVTDQNSVFISRETLIVSLFAGIIVTLMQRKSAQRGSLMFSGLITGVAAALLTAFVSMVTTAGTFGVIVTNSAWAFLGSMLGAVICLGTLSIWEALFGILTPMKLLELCDQNHPLLKKLSMEAPGTHHHSIVVANLAERGAEAIGANGLLARAAAYYHDIGKVERSTYFTENQMNKVNPHDIILPRESARIISRHTQKGYEMAKRARLANEICDIIVQHHGTMPIQYFQHKAREMGMDAEAPEFYYPGPTPQTKEAAVIMLADCMEAAVRSLHEKTPENIRQKIKELIKMRLDAGQFDQCNMTMKDLSTIANEFTDVFVGMYHDRIEYPDDKKNEGDKNEASV